MTVGGPPRLIRIMGFLHIGAITGGRETPRLSSTWMTACRSGTRDRGCTRNLSLLVKSGVCLEYNWPMAHLRGAFQS